MFLNIKVDDKIIEKLIDENGMYNQPFTFIEQISKLQEEISSFSYDKNYMSLYSEISNFVVCLVAFSKYLNIEIDCSMLILDAKIDHRIVNQLQNKLNNLSASVARMLMGKRVVMSRNIREVCNVLEMYILLNCLDVKMIQENINEKELDRASA